MSCENLKVCCTCKIEKLDGEFHFKNKIKNERTPQCKACNAIATKKYRDINKDKINTRCRTFRQNNPTKRILWSSKQRAKHYNIAFDLVESDLLCPTHCSYLGLELHYLAGKVRADNTASLDRIIPEVGYIKGNVEIISDLANHMKNSATKEQLIFFAKEVLKRYDSDI